MKQLVEAKNDLQKLNTKNIQLEAKAKFEKSALLKNIDLLKVELAQTRAELERVRKLNEDMRQREEDLKNQATGTISLKDEDLNAYRKQLIEQEKIIKERNDKISELQTQILTLSHEVSEKEMELEFYSHSMEETKAELQKLQAQL